MTRPERRPGRRRGRPGSGRARRRRRSRRDRSRARASSRRRAGRPARAARGRGAPRAARSANPDRSQEARPGRGTQQAGGSSRSVVSRSRPACRRPLQAGEQRRPRPAPAGVRVHVDLDVHQVGVVAQRQLQPAGADGPVAVESRAAAAPARTGRARAARPGRRPHLRGRRRRVVRAVCAQRTSPAPPARRRGRARRGSTSADGRRRPGDPVTARSRYSGRRAHDDAAERLVHGDHRRVLLGVPGADPAGVRPGAGRPGAGWPA